MKAANDEDTKKVLDAVGRGDSIPSGFAYDPHGKTPVQKLDQADEDAAAAGRSLVMNAAGGDPTWTGDHPESSAPVVPTGTTSTISQTPPLLANTASSSNAPASSANAK